MGPKDMRTLHGESFKLANGKMYPAVGLGTWKSPQGKTGEAVKAAIRAGYRLIDTANDYNNEHEIGAAIKELLDAGEVKREDLTIQCKLWNANHRPEHVVTDLKKTLQDLQLDYVDCFVIHWPQAVPAHPEGKKAAVRISGACPGPYDEERPEGTMYMFPVNKDGYYTSDDKSHYVETYHAMEDLVDQGLVRSLGISNFNKQQTREIVQNVKKHPVCVVQNEIHPYFQQKDYVDFCHFNNIVVQAFSPLGSGDRPACFTKDSDPTPVLENETILAIAKKHNKTTAQVVVRWHIQRGVSSVPKSITPSRVASNFEVFDFSLDAADMQNIADMNVGWQFLLWDATAMHPDYPFKESLPYGHTIPKAPGTTTASA
ncbi:Aldose reductase A [Diplonema papillatum]|nr:Aldose reductase A [Diplonema papillatum]KAJ9443095.1 Aldose reductase A [Diplonema papillatum]